MAEQFTASATISMVEYLKLKEGAIELQEVKETLHEMVFHADQMPEGHLALCAIAEVLRKNTSLKYNNIEMTHDLSYMGKPAVTTNFGTPEGKTLKLRS